MLALEPHFAVTLLKSTFLLWIWTCEHTIIWWSCSNRSLTAKIKVACSAWWKASLETDIWVSVREDYESKPLLSPWFALKRWFGKCSSATLDSPRSFWFISEESTSLLGLSASCGSDCVCLNDGYTACSNVTYVPSSRNMFDIVLGAQARSHVTVVQFFGDYLNLQHSTAGREGRDTREDQVREGRQQRTQAEASRSN